MTYDLIAQTKMYNFAVKKGLRNILQIAQTEVRISCVNIDIQCVLFKQSAKVLGYFHKHAPLIKRWMCSPNDFS